MYTHILQILLDPLFETASYCFFGNVYGASRKKKSKLQSIQMSKKKNVVFFCGQFHFSLNLNFVGAVNHRTAEHDAKLKEQFQSVTNLGVTKLWHSLGDSTELTKDVFVFFFLIPHSRSDLNTIQGLQDRTWIRLKWKPSQVVVLQVTHGTLVRHGALQPTRCRGDRPRATTKIQRDTYSFMMLFACKFVWGQRPCLSFTFSLNRSGHEQFRCRRQAHFWRL